MMNKLKNGFTLVELLIAMVIGLVIMLAIYSMMDISQKSSSGVGRRVLTQQDSRAVLDLMAMEIGMASFNPNLTNTIWNGPMSGVCSAITMVQARKGIQVADANQIGVAMDLNGTTSNASLICDVENEYILYTYNSANGTITRSANSSTNCIDNQIILGGAGSSTMIRNNLTNPVTPLFQYFDVAGTDISAAVIATPNVNIPLIRRIRINIIADVETQQGNAFKTSRRTYTTDTLVRNHAF